MRFIKNNSQKFPPTSIRFYPSIFNYSKQYLSTQSKKWSNTTFKALVIWLEVFNIFEWK